MGKSRRMGALIPVNLLSNPVASCSLIKFDALLSHAAHFHKSIIFSILVFSIFGFSLSVLFTISKKEITLFNI